MNHWLEEELTWLTHTERQRKLEVDRLQLDFNTGTARLSFTSRAALLLSDWLIASGKSLRRRHEKATPVSSWVENRNFAR